MRRKTVQKSLMGSIAVFAVIVVALQASAGAEVADSSANGFTIKITTQIQAAPAQVYRRIFRIGDWWSSEHTYSGDSHNLFIEERADGCFCEKLPNGGGVRHMNVVLLMPGEMLRMSGGLGPLAQMGLAASMTFTLEPAGAGTKLQVTYAAGGYAPGGLNSIAPTVDQVLTEQITRLKNYIEKGEPAPKPVVAKPH